MVRHLAPYPKTLTILSSSCLKLGSGAGPVELRSALVYRMMPEKSPNQSLSRISGPWGNWVIGPWGYQFIWL
eukprot:9502398-Pyramimonas_sp.AAC.1